MPTSPLDNSQARTLLVQVYRNGNWVDIPVSSAKGSIGKSRAGKLTVTIPDKPDDSARSRLFEGEKIRAFRGVVGAALTRCWTGYVDVPNAIDNKGVGRSFDITDNIKELNDSIVLDPQVYDNVAPNKAIADLISRAISTGQFKPTDDNGTALTSVANYNLVAGNPICFFPDLLNPDGTAFVLASGTVGSFTSGIIPVASLQVPVASGGALYTMFELPKRYLIASTITMPGFTIASTSSTTFPPASGSVIMDSFNGIFYFSAADGGKIASFSGNYFDSPLWAVPMGKKVGDVISEVMDKSGGRWTVDGTGKAIGRYIDTTRAPKRVLGKSQYTSYGVQSNRDRRNVIICEGWDGNCGLVVASKAINYNDINNAPPVGLGKRQYMILQDRSWKNQTNANAAAYYAIQQVGRRGKIMSASIIDDPSLNLEDVLCFAGNLPEITEGDFFYIESIDWNYTPSSNGLDAKASITGTLLPGQGLVYIGPATGTLSSGALDFTQDVTPISVCSLTPLGGKYSSTFSVSSTLTLNYTAATAGNESVDIYGSDGTHLGPYNASRTSGVKNVVLPVASMTAGVWYVVRLRFMDANGNLGYYRDFTQGTP